MFYTHFILSRLLREYDWLTAKLGSHNNLAEFFGIVKDAYM